MEGSGKLLISRECIWVLSRGTDGTAHSWCTSVHSELKSIGPISICAEYISFVLLFRPPRLQQHQLLKGGWGCVRPGLRLCVDAETCKLISFSFSSFFLTCIVAESLPLFSPPVHPSTEAHEDDPAGPPQSGNEGRLLHHVWDAVVVVRPRHYVPQFCTWGEKKTGRELSFTTWAQSNGLAWIVGLGWVNQGKKWGEKTGLYPALIWLFFKWHRFLTNKQTNQNLITSSNRINFIILICMS